TGLAALSLPGQVIGLTCAVLATCTLVIRYRRARFEERQQIKWFAGAALLLAVLTVAATVVSFLLYHNGYVVFNPFGGTALPLGLRQARPPLRGAAQFQPGCVRALRRRGSDHPDGPRPVRGDRGRPRGGVAGGRRGAAAGCFLAGGRRGGGEPAARVGRATAD